MNKMNRNRAQNILIAHSCCINAGIENNFCMACPWNGTKDCEDTMIDEELIFEAISVLKGITFEENAKLSDIKIPKEFQESTPGKNKVKKYRDYWNEYKRQLKPVVLNKNNVLLDGYIQYLTLKENGIEECFVIRRNYLPKREE